MAIPFFDMHCHINVFNNLSAKKLLEKENYFFCSCAINNDELQTSINLKKIYPQKIYISAALHPWFVNSQQNFIDKDNIKNFNISAIGETGLDYDRKLISKQLLKSSKQTIIDVKTFDYLKTKQKEIFKNYIFLANQNNLPIILHCRKAYYNILTLLKETNFTGNFMFHNYYANIEITKNILKNFECCFFSFNLQNIIEKKNYIKIKQLFAVIPITKILLETDAPFALKYENIENLIENSVSILSEIFGLPKSTVADKIFENANRFLR